MFAPDSSETVIVLLIAALGVVFFASTWVYRRRSRTTSNQFSVKIVQVMSDPKISEPHALWNTLSMREKEIARLAADYWSDDEIARELHLSVRTVQNHLQHAREKLLIHSRHEFKYFLQHLGE